MDQNGEELPAQAFHAPYTGPLSRLSSNLAARHRGTAATQTWHDPISESVRDDQDPVGCRQGIDQVVIACRDCRYELVDPTPPPVGPRGKSVVVGETVAILRNDTWTTGSQFPIHTATQHLPRYWSQPGAGAGGPLAGLFSFHHFEPETQTKNYPRDQEGDRYKTEWFRRDVYGYFQDKAPHYLNQGELDLNQSPGRVAARRCTCFNTTPPA